MDTIRVLIVDDHVGVRDALQVALGSKPNLHVMASDADFGTIVETIETTAPEVVLLEPKSFNGRGLETCREILSTDAPPAVIVLTSWRSEREELVLRELGIRRYLLKDIDTTRLYEDILTIHAERSSKSGEN